MTDNRLYQARVLPRTVVGNIHFWLTIVFFICVLGPYFDLWMNSPRLVGGVPVVVVWILTWCLIQTINLVVAYFTVMRPWAERYERDGQAEVELAHEKK